MPQATYLDAILEAHRATATREAASSTSEDLAQRALRCPEPRDFRDALSQSDGLAVIAEIKRRSPSKGELSSALDPEELARAYEAGGAACISVLTDGEFFGGSEADLRSARAACSLPVLRKDFIVSEADVFRSRIMGADALLLIVAALSDAELSAFSAIARELSLAALVEVHDEQELERALACGAQMVGVNQRDLVTFEVDRSRAQRLAGRIPADVVAVAESGISGPDEARRLAEAGYRAVLVGEAFVKSAQPVASVASFKGHPVLGPSRPDFEHEQLRDAPKVR